MCIRDRYRKWKYDDLPIVPQEWQFIVASGKEQQFSILKGLMHRSDVTEIINACDSGREGELIFRFVYEPVSYTHLRLQFSEAERATPELQKAIKKSDKAADRLDAARAAIPKQTKIKKERVFDEAKGKDVYKRQIKTMAQS